MKDERFMIDASKEKELTTKQLAHLAQTIQKAMKCHHSGELKKAEKLYHEVLKLDDTNSNALHMLGIVEIQNENYAKAVEFITQAVAIEKEDPIYYSNLGVAHWYLGQNEQAIEAYRRALLIEPNDAEVHNNLGNALRDLGELDEAIDNFKHALTLHASDPSVLYNLGLTYSEKGQLDEAVDFYQQALGLDSQHIKATVNLGNIYKEQGKLDDAIIYYQRAIKYAPNHADAHNNLGVIYKEQGNFSDATQCYQKALSINPDHVGALNNLGIICREQGRLDEAVTHYQKSLAVNPNYADTHNNLGSVLHDQNKLAEAITHFQQALALNANYVDAHHNLGFALSNQGQVNQAISHHQQGLAIHPNVAAHSHMLMTMLHDPAYDQSTLLNEHQKFYNQYIATVTDLIQRHTNDRNPERKLKIAYLSADFRDHSVAYFMEAILANHNHEQFEIYCYYNNLQNDAYTQKFKQVADHWFDCLHISDQDLANHMRQQAIDILVDLSGHSNGNRVLVLAHKPAPIMMAYLGYPNSTGVKVIDYKITDNYIDPKGQSEAFNSEKLLRMPHSWFCYSAPANSPDVNVLPAQQNGYFTFGSLNHYAKINDTHLALWAKLLKAVPNSKLVMQAKSFNDPATWETFLERCQTAEIPVERLTKGEFVASDSYLTAYHNIDIALDTFPYNGGTITCDALWMGIPVLTLVGQRHVSRMGLSILSVLEQTDFIAQTEEDYVNLAVKWVNNLDELAKRRAELRTTMQNSSLMAGKAFTQALENNYRQAWKTYCEGN